MKNKKLFILLALVLCIPVFVLPGYGLEPWQYTVTVPNENPDHVSVQASVMVSKDIIGMYFISSPGLKNGSAEMVSDLTVTRKSGGDISYTNQGQGDWKLKAVKPGDWINISYKVKLDHNRHKWGPGIDEVAYKTSNSLFFTGRSLFIVPTGLQKTPPVKVTFNMPSAWQAAVPWKTEGQKYLAPDAYKLVFNCFLLGRIHVKTFRSHHFNLTMAMDQELKPNEPLFSKTMAPLLKQYTALFNGMPSQDSYLIVVNRGYRADGGAYSGSYSMLYNASFNNAGIPVWGHGMAHELLHFWNGHTLRPKEPATEEWFKEGFTDYYTVVAMSRAGLLPQQTVFKKLENWMRRYMLIRKLMGVNVSLREAGKKKHKNHMLVYGGGALTALALDVQIRKATNGKNGLGAVMKSLYFDFAKKKKLYSYADIIAAVNRAAGKDLTIFFKRYVEGNDYLNVLPYLRDLGLEVHAFLDEIYISRLPAHNGHKFLKDIFSF